MLLDFRKETCQTRMEIELRSKKVLVPLEVKKKRIKENLPSTGTEEDSRDEEQSIVQLEEPVREQDPDVGTSRRKKGTDNTKNSLSSWENFKLLFPLWRCYSECMFTTSS